MPASDWWNRKLGGRDQPNQPTPFIPPTTPQQAGQIGQVRRRHEQGAIGPRPHGPVRRDRPGDMYRIRPIRLGNERYYRIQRYERQKRMAHGWYSLAPEGGENVLYDTPDEAEQALRYRAKQQTGRTIVHARNPPEGLDTIPADYWQIPGD